MGRGKIGNFLIRNKWRNYEAIQKISNTPILMLSAGQVSTNNNVLLKLKKETQIWFQYVGKLIRTRSLTQVGSVMLSAG